MSEFGVGGIDRAVSACGFGSDRERIAARLEKLTHIEVKDYVPTIAAPRGETRVPRFLVNTPKDFAVLLSYFAGTKYSAKNEEITGKQIVSARVRIPTSEKHQVGTPVEIYVTGHIAEGFLKNFGSSYQRE